MPVIDATRLAHCILWIWLHILQCDVANQTLDPEEDKLNKKDRPLPAGRITLRNAVILRWAFLVPVCWAVSACYSIQLASASIALTGLTVVYDEFGLHAQHWLVRNGMIAIGFALFEACACLVLGMMRSAPSDIASF